MGGADFVNVLFSEFLVYDPKNPAWEGRDRYFQDPGHMSPMLYSVLALAGKFTIDELKEFRQWGSVTPGHPEVNVMRGIENTSGPLGQGHTYAVGAAIAAKFLKARLGDVMNQTIYTYISDGGIQEEISQGAGRIAGTLGLDNLIMFYDANNIQLSTTVGEVTTENVAMKYEAWGWKVITINGNDVTEIRRALTEAKAETSRPTLIIGNTIMGKGAVGADKSSYENKVSTHGQPLSAAGVSIADTIRNLGGNPDDPKLRNYMPNVLKNWKQSLRNAMRPKQNGRKLIRNWPPRWICGSQAKHLSSTGRLSNRNRTKRPVRPRQPS